MKKSDGFTFSPKIQKRVIFQSKSSCWSENSKKRVSFLLISGIPVIRGFCFLWFYLARSLNAVYNRLICRIFPNELLSQVSPSCRKYTRNLFMLSSIFLQSHPIIRNVPLPSYTFPLLKNKYIILCITITFLCILSKGQDHDDKLL